MTRDQFIKEIAGYVCKYAPDYNILVPSAVIAQAILESGWGESALAAKYHNYFGMKCGTLWKGKSVNMETQEEFTPGVLSTITDNFRVYNSMEEGVKGYFDFIQLKRYQNLRGIKDPRTYLETISADGYATSSSYVQSCVDIINSNNLTKYDSVNVEVSSTNPIETACAWMENLANDNSHGYDQLFRWGEKGDYDCSSAVIEALEKAGVPVKSKGGATYTGNMRSVFLRYGFKDVTNKVNLTTGAGLKRSDILLNHVHHVAMYCGNGMEVEASINEFGGATGGQPGDQTGREILIRPYRNYPWDCVLRYQDGAVVTPTPVTTVSLPEIARGSIGAPVSVLQGILTMMGYRGENGLSLDIDGDFGANTTYALVEYQKAAKLTADGICGMRTWTKLKKGLKP